MTDTQILDIALVQQRCAEDREANLANSVAAIRDAAQRGARLVVLQELHLGPYFCQSEDTALFDRAEAVPGPSSEALGEVAAELGVVIVASLFERRGAGVYHNTAVVLDADGRIAGRYRKMHIPDDPGYYEKFYFTPGDLGFKPIDTAVGRLGVLVCWDQWFPEAARLMALAGAQVLIYPTAIGWHPTDGAAERQRQREAWMLAQRAHAVSNALPVVVCNRTGTEADPSGRTEGIEFWGSSFVCGPQGEFIVQAPADEPAVLVAALDLARTEQVRRIWPYLRDRRIDAYQGLLQRFLDDPEPPR